ncbi:MAG: hypothetical protein LBG13_01005 [Holosporales bacterium]|jgi:hypothetical protein|nr:hypothetical protein [Holosporales bacterium]
MLCVLSACGIFAGNCCASGSKEPSDSEKRFEDWLNLGSSGVWLSETIEKSEKYQDWHKNQHQKACNVPPPPQPPTSNPSVKTQQAPSSTVPPQPQLLLSTGFPQIPSYNSSGRTQQIPSSTVPPQPPFSTGYSQPPFSTGYSQPQTQSNVAAPGVSNVVPRTNYEFKSKMLKLVRDRAPSLMKNRQAAEPAHKGLLASAKEKLEEIERTYQKIVTKYGVLPAEAKNAYDAAVKAYNGLESLTNEVRDQLYSITDKMLAYEDSVGKVNYDGKAPFQPLLPNSAKWDAVREYLAEVFFDGLLEERIQSELAPPPGITWPKLTEQERTQYTALLEQVKQWRSNELNSLISKASQMQKDLQVLGAAEKELLGLV